MNKHIHVRRAEMYWPSSYTFNRHRPLRLRHSRRDMARSVCVRSCYGLRSGNYEIIDFDLDTRPIQHQYPVAGMWGNDMRVREIE